MCIMIIVCDKLLSNKKGEDLVQPSLSYRLVKGLMVESTQLPPLNNLCKQLGPIPLLLSLASISINIASFFLRNLI